MKTLIAGLPTRPRFSATARWTSCSGYLTIPQPLEERGSNDAALEGTIAHEAAELCLMMGLTPEQAVNGAMLIHKPKFAIDKREMELHVMAYTDYINAIVHGFEGAPDVYFELPVGIESLGVGGTADCIIYDSYSATLVVVDLKYGRNVPVAAKDNKQLMSYALASMDTLKVEPKNVELHIYQPRCKNINSAVIDIVELAAHDKIIEASLLDATSDKPTFKATEDNCKWCEHKDVCGALADTAHRKAQELFGIVGKDTEYPDSKKEARPFYEKTISRSNRQALLVNAPLIEILFAALREAEVQELENGAEPMLYELKPKRAQRKWKDEAIVKAQFGDEITETKVLTVAQAEKKLGLTKFDLTNLVESKSAGNNLTLIKK